MIDTYTSTSAHLWTQNRAQTICKISWFNVKSNRPNHIAKKTRKWSALNFCFLHISNANKNIITPETIKNTSSKFIYSSLLVINIFHCHLKYNYFFYFSNISSISCLIWLMNSKSVKLATFKSGTQLCLNPYTSPGPLNSKSTSANSKPLFVRSIAFNLSV